jgi:uncharacterized protein with gpF-like domain
MNRQTHVAVWLRMLAMGEVRLGGRTKAFLNKQANKVADAYKKWGDIEAQTAVHDGASELYKLLVASYTATVQQLIVYTAEQLSSAKKSTFEEIVQGFISKTALEKAVSINKTTASLVRDAIQKGQDDGLGELEIADLIKEKTGGAIAESRARTIARTEIHNAASYGMQAAAEETQLPMMREWVAVEDERTREEHSQADGQQRGMDEPFDVGGEALDRPGDGSPENSVNCRCTLIYIPQSGGGDNTGLDFSE